MSRHSQPGRPVIASIRRDVTHLVPLAQGGICRHVAALCRELEGAGWTCRVAGPANTLERMVEFGLPSKVAKFYTDPGSRRVPAALSKMQRLASLRGTALLFHAHGYRAAVDAAIAGLSPLVVTAHNLPPDRGVLAANFALRRADAIVAVSTGVAQALVERGVRSVKVIVAPNGIDLCPLPSLADVERARHTAAAYFDSSPAEVSFPAENVPREGGQIIPDDDTASALILAIGRLSREKGFDVLLDSFEEVLRVRPHARLLLVGSGPERKALGERVRPSIRSRVAFTGELPDARPLLPAGDVIVIPSRAEGQSLVALEALNAGVRTVASNVGGLPEMIRPGVTGWLARPGDPIDLARAIVEALAAPPNQFMAAGRTLIAEEFNPGQSLRRVLALYEELNSDRNRR